ncbi:MAG: hydroxylamine reductase [Treponema sp.]|nr:hydroxylamine reductase [Treponema sp.]
MEQEMFCYQCQETAGCKGCTKIGVCGKKPDTARLQDKLILATKKLAFAVVQAGTKAEDVKVTSPHVIDNLFKTITNANFDNVAIEMALAQTEELTRKISNGAKITPEAKTGVLATEDENIRSIRELITYGLKGLAAYLKHAAVLGYTDEKINAFMLTALAKLLDDTLSLDDYVALTMETGSFGVQAMALLDKANTETYGNPEITSVDIGVRKNPAILVSGHDLKDLEMLLEQTQGTGVDVYTHGEMLPAHYYPAFKKYENFAGNYGNAWWLQKKEFASFNGPILLTTNCLVPPTDEYKDRLFTTNDVGFPGCAHIGEDENGKKDFSAIIELARKCPAPTELETGTITGGFAHNQVFALADKVVDAVKSGAIKRFIVMAGCDGRATSRNYYSDFAKALPKDTVILTAGCAKYKYNKLNLGDIGGIPRVLDAGQCNDSYSLALIALKLKEVFNLDDINKLPIVYNIAWYEQKAVIVLLALLFLGVKNIHLGPTLPAFLSPAIASFLVEKFGIGGIATVEDDLKLFGLK